MKSTLTFLRWSYLQLLSDRVRVDYIHIFFILNCNLTPQNLKKLVSVMGIFYYFLILRKFSSNWGYYRIKNRGRKGCDIIKNSLMRLSEVIAIIIKNEIANYYQIFWKTWIERSLDLPNEIKSANLELEILQIYSLINEDSRRPTSINDSSTPGLDFAPSFRTKF